MLIYIYIHIYTHAHTYTHTHTNIYTSNTFTCIAVHRGDLDLFAHLPHARAFLAILRVVSAEASSLDTQTHVSICTFVPVKQVNCASCLQTPAA
jgi:hypothetical protein